MEVCVSVCLSVCDTCMEYIIVLAMVEFTPLGTSISFSELLYLGTCNSRFLLLNYIV